MISNRLVEIKTLQPLSLSALLVGLAGMNAQWHVLDPKFQEVLLQNIFAISQPAVGSFRTFVGMEQFVSNIIYSLGGMGATAAELSDRELSALFNLIRSTDSFSVHELSMVVYGLAKMKVSWRRIPSPVQAALAKNLLSISFDSKRNSGSSNVQACQTFCGVWGRWRQFGSTFKDQAVTQSLPRRELAYTTCSVRMPPTWEIKDSVIRCWDSRRFLSIIAFHPRNILVR